MKSIIKKYWVPLIFGVLIFANNPLLSQEISPAELPLDGGTWRFNNFVTDECGWSTFTDAFDLQWYDYLNPITYILYGIGRYDMCNGHCYGMCLLINHIGEEDPDAIRIPYAGRLEEPIFDNYPTLTSNLQNGIQVYHWRQFSTEVVSKGFDALFHSTSEMRDQIDRDTRNEKFGLISIFHNGAGHVLVPYGVVAGLIYVYDPNRPRGGMRDTRFTFASPFRIIGEDGWSYEMADGTTWTNMEGDMFYIPFEWSNQYKNLANGLIDMAIILLGENTKVKQITDNGGKTFYSNTNKNGQLKVNTTKTGLRKDIFKFTIMSDGNNEKCDLAEEEINAPDKDDLIKMMIRKYGSGYGTKSEIFIVKNKNLKNLKIETTAQKADNKIKLAIGNGQDFYEMELRGTTKNKLNSTIRINDLSNLNQGVKLMKTQVPAVSQISYGKINKASKKLELQTITALNLKEDSYQITIAPNKQLSVSAANIKGKALDVEMESINDKGILNKLGTKQIQIKQ